MPDFSSRKDLAVRRRVILVVQPQDENRVTLAVMLRREGYVVIEADDVQGALELIRDNAPALVVTHARLTRGSGAELVRTLRTDQADPRLRVLAVGASDQRDDLERAGADGFIVLPSAPEQVVRLIVQEVGRA